MQAIKYSSPYGGKRGHVKEHVYEGGLGKSVTDEEYKSPKKTRPLKASDYSDEAKSTNHLLKSSAVLVSSHHLISKKNTKHFPFPKFEVCLHQK